MASIFGRKNKDGSITYRAMIRRKGYPILCRSFATHEEASDFVKCEESYCTNPEKFNITERDRLIASRKREYYRKQKRPRIAP